MYNTLSTSKVAPEKLESHQPGVVLLFEKNAREVFMGQIMKVCRIHGDLEADFVNKRKNCKLCVQDHNKRSYLRYKESRLKKAEQYRKENQEHLMLWQRNYRKKHYDIIKKNEEKIDDKRGYTRRFGELLKKRGITKEQFDHMVKNQNNKCAICKEPETCKDSKRPGIRRLAIDHCHKTGKTRGLLCHKCNLLIAYAKESIDVFENAISYIRHHS